MLHYTIALIKAQAFKRSNGKEVGKSRIERIELKKNILFSKCRTVLDIKEAYENFWNHLNTSSKEVVFVQSIELV